MSNSSLVTYTKLSPFNTGKRTHGIDRITPHCYVGQTSVESAGREFSKANKNASCNYCIGYDGRVALIVPEDTVSWCSSNQANDNRAVTIECASDAYAPYKFNDTVYNKLVQLCADICKRNGKTKLIWLGDKNKTLNYSPASNEMVLTVHRWFAQKSCPGDWMMARMGNLASEVTAKLTPIQAKPYAVFRFLNAGTGDHIFTADIKEANQLRNAGWIYEGIPFYHADNAEPVYRLFNGSEHFLTMNEKEKDNLVKAGWKYEGIAFSSGKGKPVYRLLKGKHMYVLDCAERTNLKNSGWKEEGIAFYTK